MDNVIGHLTLLNRPLQLIKLNLVGVVSGVRWKWCQVGVVSDGSGEWCQVGVVSDGSGRMGVVSESEVILTYRRAR